MYPLWIPGGSTEKNSNLVTGKKGVKLNAIYIFSYLCLKSECYDKNYIN